MPLRIFALFVLLAAVLSAACGGGGYGDETATPAGQLTPSPEGSAMPAMLLTSEAFQDNETIPVEYTCDGDNASPQLAWSGAPSNARAFALVMHDPDAPRSGGYTHWVLYDLPASVTQLDKGVSPDGRIPEGASEGKNSAGKNEYAGPCPPRGSEAHHYGFTLYALDAPLGLGAGKTKDEVEKAMRGHVVAEGTLTGLYARR